MVLADARAGRGAVVLDPKGDMVNDLLDRLPTSVAGRLVLIDPAETGAPAALNILDSTGPELAADQVVTILPAHLRGLVGTAHGRHPALRLPHPRPRAGRHPGRCPGPAG